MKKTLLALMLGLVSLTAVADKPATPAASGKAAAMGADDYLRCASQYFLLSQMKGHPMDINYGSAVGLAKTLAVVVSSEDYVDKHQPLITADELKKIQTAEEIGTLPVYMDGFRMQLRQCAKAIDAGGNKYGPELQAYAKRHGQAESAAASAASGGH